MAMSAGSAGDGDVMVDINTTPLIDVMLVLLIMLIITIPIQTHAVKLNMPQNTPPRDEIKPIVVEIVIDFDGQIQFGGDVIKDRGDLELHMYRLAQIPTQPEVHLIPNKLAPYKYVAEVMAEAQRLGVTKIGIVGNEQFTH